MCLLYKDINLTRQVNNEDNPFAEYMWMENEEEFNSQVVEELWEQEQQQFIEQCFLEMVGEEDDWTDWFIPARDLPQMQDVLNLDLCDGYTSDILTKSTLNPNAEEFIPGLSTGTHPLDAQNTGPHTSV